MSTSSQPGFRIFNLAASMLGCATMVLFTVGCGGSDPSESTVVPPPTPNIVASDDPADVDPPGSIELPDGEIPAAEPGDGDADPGPSGGLEMPADAKLPDSAAALDNEDSAATVDVVYQPWSEIASAAASSGMITVVDLWSLSCEPCLKEFPGLVRLKKELGDKVECMSVNLDFDGRKSRPPEYYEQRVVAFLDSVKATSVSNYISRTPNEDVFALNKIASIPAVLVFNADGEMVHVFVDAGETAGFTYEKDVLPLVTKLAG